MARSIIWAPAAANDLDAIAQYIAHVSKASAAKLVKKILSVASELDRFPHLGMMAADLKDPSIRQRIISHYRLIYRIETDNIVVLAVIHERRSLGPLFNRLED